MANIVVKTHAADVNKVHFQGVIVGRRENSAAVSVMMRVSTKQGTRIYTNHPQLSVFDADLKAKVNALPLRVPVVVDGYITSRKAENSENEVVARPLQSFIMTDIRPAAEGETANVNEVELIGSVERAYVSRGNVIHFIIVSFREGHYMKRIKVDYFTNKEKANYEEIIGMMISGTKLHIKGHCSTVTKEASPQQDRDHEYIIVDEIERA